MICIASRIGVIARLNVADRPASTPSGMPTASDMPTAANISAKVWTLSSQRPSVAKLDEGRERPERRLAAAEAQHDERPERRRPDHLR